MKSYQTQLSSTFSKLICVCVCVLMASAIPLLAQPEPPAGAGDCEDCMDRFHKSYPTSGDACAGVTKLAFWSEGMQDEECGFRIDVKVYKGTNQVYWGQSGTDIFGDNNIEVLNYDITQTGDYRIVVRCQKRHPCEDTGGFLSNGNNKDRKGKTDLKAHPGIYKGDAELDDGWVTIGKCEYNFSIFDVSYPIPADFNTTVNNETYEDGEYVYLAGCEDIDYIYEHIGVQTYYNQCSQADVCEHRWYFDHNGVRYYPNQGWRQGLPTASPPNITSMSTLIPNLLLQAGDVFTLNLDIRHDHCLVTETITFKYLDPEETLPLYFLVDYGNLNCPRDPDCIEDKYDIPGEASQVDGIHEIYTCAEPAPVGGRRTVPLHDLFFQWDISSWEVKVFENICHPSGSHVVEFFGNSSFHDITTTPISSYHVPGNLSQDFYFTMNPGNFWTVQITFTDHCNVERVFQGIFEVNLGDEWGFHDDDAPPVSLRQQKVGNTSFSATSQNVEHMLNTLLPLNDCPNGKLQIYSTVGKEVGSGLVSDEHVVFSSYLNTGVYFYTLTNRKGTLVSSGKFLIE